MINLKISDAKNDFYKLATSCIKNDEVVNISTENGNVVLISENNYKNIIESLNLMGIKCVYEDIEETVRTSTPEFLKEAPWE